MKFPKFNLPLITFLSVAVGCTLLSTYPVQFNDSSTLDNVVQKCASHVENNPPIYESFVDGAIKDCVNEKIKLFLRDKPSFNSVDIDYSKVSDRNTLYDINATSRIIDRVNTDTIQYIENKRQEKEKVSTNVKVNNINDIITLLNGIENETDRNKLLIKPTYHDGPIYGGKGLGIGSIASNNTFHKKSMYVQWQIVYKNKMYQFYAPSYDEGVTDSLSKVSKDLSDRIHKKYKTF